MSEDVRKLSSAELLAKATPRPWQLQCVKTSCGRCWKLVVAESNDHNVIACLYDDDTSLNTMGHVAIAANAELLNRMARSWEAMRAFADLFQRYSRENCQTGGIQWDDLERAAANAIALCEPTPLEQGGDL